MAQSIATLESFLDQMPGYFFVKDTESRFLGCSAQFAEFAGETRESIIGKSEHEMPWADEAEHFMSDDQRVIRTGEPLINYREPKHGNTIITNKVPYRDEGGDIIGVIGVFFIVDGEDL